MAENTKSKEEIDMSQYIGRRIRLIGDHPWAGESAEVVGFDKLGMRVKLLRMDAMHGHESYVTGGKQFRPERKGLDW